MHMRKTQVKQDPKNGEFYIEFDPELFDSLGWEIGDTIVWTEQSDGSFMLSKKLDNNE